MQDTPVVVSIFPNFQDKCVIGMAYVDLTRRILGLAEFLDDSRFTNLESSLVALGAKECILPAESCKSNYCKSLYDSLERCSVMITERKRLEFKGRDLDSDLNRLVKGNIEPIKDLISGFDLVTPALGALLSFSELLVEYSVDLDQLENGEYMISLSYDTTLSSLKDQKELLEQQIHELHKKTAMELDRSSGRQGFKT